MKFQLLILFLLITKVTYPQNDIKFSASKIANIKNVITLFKQNDIDKIASIIQFPLERDYPIPSIKDKREFTQRFSEVFDKELVGKIANSKVEQWDEVGWRGIMLNNGIIWVNSYDGKIIAVNYQSSFEKKLRKQFIAKEKESLHPSLKTFESPTYKIKTKNYLIRIDQLSNHSYRYASWKVGKNESSEPEIILNNGELKFEGSGGNHVITFLNGDYKYNVYRFILGGDGIPDVILQVEKNGKIILKENGTLKK